MNIIKSRRGYFCRLVSARRLAYYFYLFCVAVAVDASLILISSDVNAQTIAQTAGTAPPAGPAASSTALAATPLRYSATEIERAFNFMDANRDGKISREEAAAFRNVARHFDAADTNKDNTLSLEEFGNALNRP
ncbi:MAG: EF-hand domain-containing protein [Polaromonas sp.]|nr:EF-hand domain-containing protein [Polaromonas sp.]